ncbi:hypothetical protein [Nostoc sp. UHCC 0251]|uniref:hypothetical protein n=1 Tax=Nostoc sp. UHCC 0251 TaxID=3110240 RepID=UPI002B20B8E5|nr:hypothetical protein [Nostoc sp. UHCC 0251]MEA5624785.1 hypothetical protein [Nostoc sp. UHCC 0251]
MPTLVVERQSKQVTYVKLESPRLKAYGVHTSRKKLDFPFFSRLSRLSRSHVEHGNAPRGGSA